MYDTHLEIFLKQSIFISPKKYVKFMFTIYGSLECRKILKLRQIHM